MANLRSYAIITIVLLGTTFHSDAIRTMKFNVAQYNIFGRPYTVSNDGQNERLSRIPRALINMLVDGADAKIDLDVITFAEADIESERLHMLQEFKRLGFAYASTILKDPDPFTSLLNGGVLIVSKWPIIHEGQHIYRDACHYSDCLAAKGVKYARLNKTVDGISKAFNVFATHMQAWSTPDGRQDRIKQASQMRQFVKDLQVPPGEPLIFAGDFNVDNHAFPDEVKMLIKTLDAVIPQVLLKSQSYTSDPHTNLLVGRDGAAVSNKCSDLYKQSWGALKNKTYYPNLLTRINCGHTKKANGSYPLIFQFMQSMCYCPCCPFEWLDYILYGKEPYQQPVRNPQMKAYPLKDKKFVVKWSSDSSMELEDLSDHYPVIATFEFSVRKNETIKIFDGCTDDNDCRFHWFRCYCAGPGCHYKGKVVNGYKYSSNHPVNKNCLYQKTGADCLCGPN